MNTSLCSFGIAVKHVLKMYCDNDVKLFKSVKARFNKPVIPEQTLKTNTWLEKENNIYKVYFECKVNKDIFYNFYRNIIYLL